MYRLVILAFIARYEAPLRDYATSRNASFGMLLDAKYELFGVDEAATIYGNLISDCIEELERRDRQP